MRMRLGRAPVTRTVTDKVSDVSSSNDGARSANPCEFSVRARSTGSPRGPASASRNDVVMSATGPPERSPCVQGTDDVDPHAAGSIGA